MDGIDVERLRDSSLDVGTPDEIGSDRPGPIRVYERIGFREAGRVASALSVQPNGSSGST